MHQKVTEKLQRREAGPVKARRRVEEAAYRPARSEVSTGVFIFFGTAPQTLIIAGLRDGAMTASPGRRDGGSGERRPRIRPPFKRCRPGRLLV